MKYLCVLFFVSIFYLSNAQINFNNYKPLECSGKIPEDLLKLLVEEGDTEQNDRVEKKLIHKERGRFFLKSDYLVGELLRNGRVLFNDPITEYVNRVAQNLLKGYPALQKEVKIYITRSPAINAFTTDKGIFINMGMIAGLVNEAELAYVLAREIVHYTEKHLMELDDLNKFIANNQQFFRYEPIDVEILNKSYWQEKVEMETDEVALAKYYAQSGYSLEALGGVFDMLEYSYLIFDDIPFDKSFLESDYFSLPDELFSINRDELDVDKHNGNTSYIHPNIKKRGYKIILQADNFKKGDKANFIEPVEDFEYVHKIARFEAINEQLMCKRYLEAFYNSYIMLKHYPDNVYLKKSIASALYRLAKYRNQGDINEVLPYYSDIIGGAQQLYFIFSSMSKIEYNVLALRYVWLLKQQCVNDVYLNKICDDLFKMLIVDNHLSSFDFSRESQKTVLGKQKNVDSGELLNKYERIMQNSNKRHRFENWVDYVFVDCFKDQEFVEEFRTLTYNEENARMVFLDNKRSSMFLRGVFDKEAVEEFRQELYGSALGLEKLMLIEPFNIEMVSRNKEDDLLVDARFRFKDFIEKVMYTAHKANLELVLWTSSSLKAEDVEKYNELTVLKAWVIELLQHDNRMNIIPLNYEQVLSIGKKYEVKYIDWSGFITMKNARVDLHWIYVLIPDYFTYHFHLLYDIESAQHIFSNNYEVKMKARPDIVYSILYDAFYQISKSK